jgi:hypothetical protein
MPHSSDRNNLRQPPVNCQSIRYPGRHLPPLLFPGPGLSIHRKCVNYADVALEAGGGSFGAKPQRGAMTLPSQVSAT